MARPPRLEFPGVAHHVLQRGVNRMACFFGDADRRFYLKCLADAAARRGCAIHAYVLMGNHVHLLATPSEPGAIGAMMQDLGRRYVRVINTLHDSSSPCAPAWCRTPAAYAWSSHAHYAGGRPNALIEEHPERPIEEKTLARLREAVNTDSAFGSDAFLDRLEGELGRSARVPVRGRPPRSVTGKLL